MTDNHGRSVDAVERLRCWSRSLLVVGLRIIERHVGRYHVMTVSSQPIDDQLPARPVVPLTVDEAERDQARVMAQPEVADKRSERFEPLK